MKILEKMLYIHRDSEELDVYFVIVLEYYTHSKNIIIYIISEYNVIYT
jgi:hypothetical protein